ncbi:hypothetical protein CHUAL_002610 [Chamberlinius hualienensis]
MASTDNDPDLDALRLAVLATLKSKNGADKVKANDSELEELRKAALKSKTKKLNENSVKNSPPAADFGKKRFNRHTNLIVIQPIRENEPKKSEISYASELLRPQDAYCPTNSQLSSGSSQPSTQHRPKGTDKFSRFESSSSSEDESDYSDSETNSSDKLSQTSENKSSGDINASDENNVDNEDVLVLQPDESFDENVEKSKEEAGDDAVVNSDNKTKQSLPGDTNKKTLDKRVSDRRKDRNLERDERSSRSIKRPHKEESDRNIHRKHRKQVKDRDIDRRQNRRTRSTRDRREEERRKENSESLARNKDLGRPKLSSILSKPASDEKNRSFARETAARSNSLEKSGFKSNDRHDLREKLKSRKRSGNEMRDDEEKVKDAELDDQPETKRRSRGTSEDRKSRSPPIKSVLSVVKLSSTVTDNSTSKKRHLDSTTTANCNSKSNDSVKSLSPLRPETSPERKVLIKTYSHKYASDGDTDNHINVVEETVRKTDSNGSSSPSFKQKLPVHLRLGNVSTASSNNKHSLPDKKRKSLSPSNLSSATSSTNDGKSGGDRKPKSRQVVKLNSDRVRSIATILNKHSGNDRLPTTNKVQQIAGKTFENELDEKIRRIRVNNLAIMKRKSEIERERHSNG